MTTLERIYHLLNHTISHEENGDLQEWFPEREAKELLQELEPLAFPPPTTTASADGLNLLKPDENSSAYLAAMRAKMDESTAFHASLHERYCRGPGQCRLCFPQLDPKVQAQSDAHVAVLAEMAKVTAKPHEGKQRAIYDWRAGTHRVYTRNDGLTITAARDCSEHEAAAVDAGLWVDP